MISRYSHELLESYYDFCQKVTGIKDRRVAVQIVSLWVAWFLLVLLNTFTVVTLKSEVRSLNRILENKTLFTMPFSGVRM